MLSALSPTSKRTEKPHVPFGDRWLSSGFVPSATGSFSLPPLSTSSQEGSSTSTELVPRQKLLGNVPPSNVALPPMDSDVSAIPSNLITPEHS